MSRRDQGAYEIRRSLSSFGNFPNAQCKHRASHCFPILIFVQLPIQIQLKIHQFCGTQSHDNLARICRRCNDGLARGHAPFVYPAVNQDVSNALWMDLQECVVPNLLHGKSWCGRKKSGVLDFFYVLTDRKDKSAVHEGKDDVGVVDLCKKMSLVPDNAHMSSTHHRF